MPFNFKIPDLSGFSLESVSQLASGNNFILPLLGLFVVRFFFSRLIFGSLGLLPIIAIVFLIFSTQPDIMQGFGSFAEVPAKFDKSYIMPALILAAIFFMFRPQRLSPVTLLMLALIAYLLFSRDFRIDSIVSEGSWKTSLVGLTLLIAFCLFFLFRRRAFNPYQRTLSYAWVQPMLLGAALSFAVLILYNPAWLEVHLPGWRSSIGFGVLICSTLGFLYNLPLRFRPYAICGGWLFVVITLGKVILVS